MRKTKLFAIIVNNIDEANQLKEKLSNLKIEEVENSVQMSYSGFITCDIAELEDEVELTVYTFFEKTEFEETVFECCITPKFFQYERREIF